MTPSENASEIPDQLTSGASRVSRGVLLLLALVGAATADENFRGEFRVVGYLPDYRAAEYGLEAARGVTDLLVFSAEPTPEGGIDLRRLERAPWERLREFKTRQRVRLILSLGGWGRSNHFGSVATSEEKRRKFAEAAVRVCLERRLDGIDLDWEHPKDAAEEEGYGKLLAAIHEVFRPQGLVLSMTVAGWQRLPAEGIAAVDTVNVMAYDLDGRHSTFEGATADVKKLLDQGVPPEKIVLGMPFYGRSVESRRRTLTYREIVAKHHPAADVDEVDGLYFNGPETIQKKTAWAIESGLGGVMVWELGQDAGGEEGLLGVIRRLVDRRSQ